MDEICFNGLDDDGDGLYDAFDPDCSCQSIDISSDTLVPNGQFEHFDECCVEMATQAGVCLDDWFLVTLSPDFVSPDCASDIGFFESRNIAFDGSFIDIGFSSNASSPVRSESMGVCLNNGLSQGESYTISFSTAILTELELDGKKDELFTIYGLPTCPDIADIDVSQGFCESPLFAQAQEIATVRLFDTERDEWVNHLQNFQPEFEINSIVLYANCNQGQVASIGTFFYLDNIDIVAVPELSTIEGEILRSDDPCDDEVTLTASSPAAESYQWYQDSIPIVGATDSILRIVSTNPTAAYSAFISNDNECILLEPVTIQQFVAVESVVIYDTLCFNGAYTFYDSLILDAGIYTEVLGQTSDGCDSLAILDLYFHPIISSAFVIQPGLNLNAGDSLTITPDADFLSQLSSFRWLDQGVPIDGSSSILSVTSDISEIRNFTFEFVGLEGCAYTTVHAAEWILQGPVDEDCITQSDIIYDTLCVGGEYIFYDSLILDAGIYTELLGQTRDGCDSIAVLDLFFHSIISPVLDIQPGLNLNAGDNLTITPDTDFLSQLSSFRWLDQGVPIDGSSSILSVTSDISEIRNFTLEYVGLEGCELTTGLTAEWILQTPVDEDCSNGIDDDLDGLIDNFDDDCPCTMDQNDQVVLSETICQGSTFLFGDIILDEAGIYTDTFVNILNCDSIVTLELTVIDDFQDTIDISITEGQSYNFEGTEYSESGFYSFAVEDNLTSCDSTFYLNLTVNPPFSIYIPNVISLNSATGNDEFLISSNREVNIVELLVFNRWGNIVHNGSGFNIDEEDTYTWNGRFNGQKVSQGLFIYKLTYEQGEKRRTIVGDITVID